MTEEDKQKLNEKLAKWGGLEVDDIFDMWKYPPPNFTDSLDACFKWLVPKLPDYDGIEFWESTEGWVCDIVYGISIEDERQVAGIGSNPALALCLAIEKLIDET